MKETMGVLMAANQRSNIVHVLSKELTMAGRASVDGEIFVKA